MGAYSSVASSGCCGNCRGSMAFQLMIKKLALAAIIWMLSASPVWAENWVRAASSDITDHYLDTDSVRKNDWKRLCL